MGALSQAPCIVGMIGPDVWWGGRYKSWCIARASQSKSARMLQLLKIALVCLALLICPAVTRNGCRQCTGDHILNFKDFVNIGQVKTFVYATLGKCATGNNYEVKGWNSWDCQVGDITSCRTWMINYQIWRYCGNGGKVFLDNGLRCIGDLCVLDDRLRLLCHKSVDCVGNCNCSECGC